MLQISIIVFREILEIAIVIGILCAVTKDLKNRSVWIMSGLVGGILGSITLAFFMKSIGQSFAGHGEELFNALVLLTAALMIGYTVIWMRKHARQLSSNLKEVGQSIKEGKKSLIVLALITFFTVIREGAEIVLFSYSYYIDGLAISSILAGLGIGLIFGSITGIAMYFGMLKAFGKYFFKITSWILVLLSSAIMMKSIGYFVKAEILPALGSPIIDLSTILPKASFFGQFLHVTLGYIDKPYGLQLIAYIATLTILTYLLKQEGIRLNKALEPVKE